MNTRLGVLLMASTVPLAAATPLPAQITWNTLAPPGQGFSIEVPGVSQPTGEPGHYVYNLEDWAFIIKVDAVSPAIREFVEKRQQEPLAWFLDKIAHGLTKNETARVISLSAAEFDGYPSRLISLEDRTETTEIEGIDRLVLTEEHLYMLITVGRKGTPRADAERFLGSFRLIKSPSSPSTTSATPAVSSTNPLVTKMAGPMRVVARLIAQEQLNPGIDQMVQRAPPAEALGDRWNSSHPAWQQARASITDRIARMFEIYETSGEVEQALEAELSQSPGSERDVLAAALNGPAGGAILRNCGAIEFVSTVMASDPNGPKAGERAWGDKMRALKKVFDERSGAQMPQDDGTHQAEVSEYLNGPTHSLSMGLWSAVVGKATNQLVGAINLMMFDDRENIWREIEQAIADAK